MRKNNGKFMGRESSLADYVTLKDVAMVVGVVGMVGLIWACPETPQQEKKKPDSHADKVRASQRGNIGVERR